LLSPDFKCSKELLLCVDVENKFTLVRFVGLGQDNKV
jgi:hypothetical protein